MFKDATEMILICWTWVLNEVGLHQVVEDVVLSNPLHRAATGGAKRGSLHPARVAGSTEHMHARLQAKAKKTNKKNRRLGLNSHTISIWRTCCTYAKCLTKTVGFKPLTLDMCENVMALRILPDTVVQ